VVEDLGLAALSRGDQVLVENGKNVLADLGKLGLNLLAVLLDEGDLLLVALGLLLLLNGGDDSPGCTASTDDVLVGDRKEVSLLDRELLVGGSDVLHVLDHLWRRAKSDMGSSLQIDDRLTLIALSLLGELGQVNGILVTHF
jgi:hypothetical protein